MGVLVLGMHRSGTSALTRVLSLLGLDAGRDVLMGASESNPTGHWEVERLTSFNDRLLDVLGGRWSAPPAVERRATVGSLASGPWGDEAATLHEEAFGDTAWVWKDPRVSLLLPFWREVLGRDGAPPAEVVALRDPAEIAASLAARDGVALGYGYALWERYTRTLLGDLDGRRACFVPYERLLAEPEGVARELVAYCADEPLSDDPDRLAAVARYLDRGHRHQEGPTGEEPSASQVALDEAVLGLSGAVDPFSVPGLPVETPNLQLAFDEAKRLSWYVEETDRLGEKVEALEAELERQVTTLNAEIDARSAQAADLAEQVMLIRAEADDYLRQLEDIRSKLPMRVYAKLKRSS